MNYKTRLRTSAPAVLRIGMSLVFLWFGMQQLLHPGSWISYIPDYASSISGLGANVLVHINGAFEVVFGLALLGGSFTRATALLLALHMFDICFTVGYNEIGIRDFGLAVATLAVFMYGSDRYSLDAIVRHKEI